MALNLPFAVWSMGNHLVGIPGELEEAATVDGAGPVRTALAVVLPLARPGLFTAGMLTFTATWTEFLLALTFNGQDEYRTVPVGIAVHQPVPGAVRDDPRRGDGGDRADRGAGGGLPPLDRLGHDPGGR